MPPVLRPSAPRARFQSAWMPARAVLDPSYPSRPSARRFAVAVRRQAIRSRPLAKRTRQERAFGRGGKLRTLVPLGNRRTHVRRNRSRFTAAGPGCLGIVARTQARQAALRQTVGRWRCTAGRGGTGLAQGRRAAATRLRRRRRPGRQARRGFQRGARRFLGRGSFGRSGLVRRGFRRIGRHRCCLGGRYFLLARRRLDHVLRRHSLENALPAATRQATPANSD